MAKSLHSGARGQNLAIDQLGVQRAPVLRQAPVPLVARQPRPPDEPGRPTEARVVTQHHPCKKTAY